MKLVKKYMTHGAVSGAITAAGLIFIQEFLGAVLSFRSTPTIEMAFAAAAAETLNRIVHFDEGFVEVVGTGVTAGLVVGLGMEVVHFAAHTFFGNKQKVPVQINNNIETVTQAQPG